MKTLITFFSFVCLASLNSQSSRVVDRNGNEILYPLSQYEETGGFEAGFSTLRKNGQWGFLDRNGNEIVKPQYQYVTDFYEGFARILKDNQWGFLNTSGREIVVPQYEAVEDFREGFAAVLEDSLWGYIDTNGYEIVKPPYDLAWYKHDLEIFGVRRNERWGYIDNNGKEIVPCVFEKAMSVAENTLLLSRDNRYGLFFMDEKTVIPAEYEDIARPGDPLGHGQEKWQMGLGKSPGRHHDPVPL